MDGVLAFLREEGFEPFETILPADRARAPPAPANRPPAILFVDDFDLPPAPSGDASGEPEIIAPVFTEADIDAARAIGRESGLAEARLEHQAVQAEICAAAMTAIGDALANAREGAAQAAHRVAEDLASAILALLQAALPAASETLAGSEIEALMHSLAPALKRENGVQIRLHGKTLTGISENLGVIFCQQNGCLTLIADDTMARADAVVIWAEGEARRETGRLWEEIRVALAPYALPSLHDILKGADHGQ